MKHMKTNPAAAREYVTGGVSQPLSPQPAHFNLVIVGGGQLRAMVVAHHVTREVRK